ncbi:MAG TPA: FMN-binding glutamate synthase family protein, partial [Candidatus Desulfofervidus auxilii]|nr:FMN-binding glutamate synthase family protein [Candidatus Desulfofervidus auxilii]
MGSWPPEVKGTTSRFKRPLGKYKIIKRANCNNCGLCVKLCPCGVYKFIGKKVMPLREYRCIGFSCEGSEHYCVAQCPEKALMVIKNPTIEALGDYRWTSDLILSTWYQAETGNPPDYMEYKIGNSGGGFDRLRFSFEFENQNFSLKEDVSTTIDLNRRNDGRPQVTISVPWYGGGMSFGSVSLTTMLARAKACMEWNTFTCTGEGGYPEALIPYKDHVITQVATGLFGVREETIKRARIVEFKYAQGAKPGLGGHLLGDKVTPDVARMRESV